MIETSLTFLFAGGYYDAGTNNDKIALLMRIGYSSGSGGNCAGWNQAAAGLNYFYVKVLKYSEIGGSKFIVAMLEKSTSGGGIGVTRIIFDSSFGISS